MVATCNRPVKLATTPLSEKSQKCRSATARTRVRFAPLTLLQTSTHCEVIYNIQQWRFARATILRPAFADSARP